MFTETIVQKLKQNNISVDAEKTKARTTEAWKSAGRANQGKVLALAGVARTTVQRAYKLGRISAKLVVPLAQTLNISPFYLTGESDEHGECTEELLKELLQNHRYDKLLAEYEKEQRKLIKKAKKLEQEQETVECECVAEEEAEAEVEAAAEPAVIGTAEPDAQDDLSMDDMIILMKSILLKSKANEKYAGLTEQLKSLLLS